MSGAVLSASVGFPQQPIVQENNESGSLNPVLPIGFIKNQTFLTFLSLIVKIEQVCFLNPTQELVPQDRGLIVEGLSAHFNQK